MLYALYNSPDYGLAFNDVTTGSTTAGLSAATGFDPVTGLGTPKADFLVDYLGGSITLPTPEPSSFASVGLFGTRRRRPRRWPACSPPVAGGGRWPAGAPSG